MKKRLIALLLTLAMVLTMLPTAFAADAAAVSGQTAFAEAVNAASADAQTTIALSAGTYQPGSLNMRNKDIVFTGTKDVVLDYKNVANQNASGATLTFVGVTVEFANTNYRGLQHTKKVVFQDCTIIGKQFLYAETVEFTGCVFENTSDYCVWTYGAKNVTFTDCVFNTGGKAVLVYNEETNSNFVANISVTNCEFNGNGTFTDKAAIETGTNASGAASNVYNITVTGSAANGFAANNSSSPLVGNKNSMELDKLTGSIDAEPIQKASVTVGGKGYAFLQTAIEAAADGDTITILEDITVNKWTANTLNKTITIEGCGNTISGLTAPLFSNINKGITIKNLTIDGAKIAIKSASGADNDTGAGAIASFAYGGEFIFENVSVKNSTITGDGYVGGYIGFADHPVGTISVTGGEISGNTLTAGGAVGGVVGHTYVSIIVNGTVFSNNILTSTSDGGTRPDKVGLITGRLTDEQVGETITVNATVKADNALSPAGVNPYSLVGSVVSGGASVGGGSYPSNPLVIEGSIQPTAPAGMTFAPNADGTYVITSVLEGDDGALQKYWYRYDVGMTAILAEQNINAMVNLSVFEKQDFIAEIDAAVDAACAKINAATDLLTAQLASREGISAINAIVEEASRLNVTLGNNIHVITFDANGGTASYYSDLTGTDGRLAGFPDAIREGYIFGGWFMDRDGHGEITYGTTFNKNTTVYAYWTQEDIYVPYIDVPTDAWYFDDVMFTYYKGLMNGVSAYEFAPDKTLNRATLLTTLWRLSGSPKVANGITFTDLQEGTWYTDAMKWAIANGIIEGYGDNTCRPLNNITHEQACAILRRYASLNGRDVNAPSWAYNAPKYSTWAKDDALWAVNNGIYATFGSDVSDLTKTATRGEVAAYLQVICNLLGK